MKKAFFKCFFTLFIFLCGCIKFYANDIIHLSDSVSLHDGSYRVDKDTFKDEFLPISSTTRFDLENLVAEIVEGEEFESGNERHKGNSNNFKELVSNVFFLVYCQTSFVQYPKDFFNYNLKKPFSDRKIYIQFEVFRI